MKCGYYLCLGEAQGESGFCSVYCQNLCHIVCQQMQMHMQMLTLAQAPISMPVLQMPVLQQGQQAVPFFPLPIAPIAPIPMSVPQGQQAVPFVPLSMPQSQASLPAQTPFVSQASSSIHTATKRFECSLCGGEYGSKGSLKVHMRQHTGERPYECDECGGRFSSASILLGHSRTHTGEKRFKCKKCNRCFAHQSSVYKHVQRAHTTGLPPYVCTHPGCKAVIKNEPYTIKQHNLTHAVQKPYACTCGFSCIRHNVFAEHVRGHLAGE